VKTAKMYTAITDMMQLYVLRLFFGTNNELKEVNQT
jgi:hypothetical protein